MSRTVAQPVAHNERAGMFMKVVLKAVPGVRCVVCWFVVLCCVVSGLFRGTFLEQLFEPFDGGNVEPTFDMEREARFYLFTFLPVSARLFASFLASPSLFGPSGWAGGTTFYVSSRLFSFFRVSSRFSPPLRAGRRDDF